MTSDEAEQIWMANQVGAFTGTQGELAETVLILSQDQDSSEEARPMSEPNCPRCSAALEKALPAWRRWECWSMDWRNAPEFNRDNEVIGEKKFRQSDKCRIRELETECERLVKDKERLRKGVEYWSYVMWQGMHKECPELRQELLEFLGDLEISPYDATLNRYKINFEARKS